MCSTVGVISTVGCSVLWGYHEYRGGYLEYHRGCWRYIKINEGGYLEYCPGDPKPLVTLQVPQKVSIEVTLHQSLQKRKLEETTVDFAF